MPFSIERVDFFTEHGRPPKAWELSQQAYEIEMKGAPGLLESAVESLIAKAHLSKVSFEDPVVWHDILHQNAQATKHIKDQAAKVPMDDPRDVFIVEIAARADASERELRIKAMKHGPESIRREMLDMPHIKNAPRRVDANVRFLRKSLYFSYMDVAEIIVDTLLKWQAVSMIEFKV